MRDAYVVVPNSKINQILCAIIISLPVFAFGSCIGWMSPMSLLLQSKNSPRDIPLSDVEISWMASLPFLVCVPFNYIMAFMADYLGRKVSLIFMLATCALLWIIKLVSLETWAFVFSRSLVGISMAGAYVICPAYIKEISEDSIRGILGTLVMLCHTTGILFLYVIGDLVDYHLVLWISLALPLVMMALLMLFVPESPSYLVKRKKYEAAAKALAWLRCKPVDHTSVKTELNQIEQELQRDDNTSKFKLKAIIKDNILFRALRIAVILILAREICGGTAVLNFAAEIFAMASSETDLVLTPNQQAMLLGVVQVSGSLLASCVVEKAGRKPLLFTTSLVSGLSMGTLAVWFLLKMLNLFDPPSWIPVTTLCICIFCDSAGLLPVSVVITGEIFSFKYRGTVLATTEALACLVSFLLLLFFKPLASTIGVYVTFFFFAAVCILQALYVILVIPETKRRKLAEIYEDLKTKKEKERDRELTQTT